MATMFDQFKATLAQAVSDEDFRRKNYLFQNPTYLQAVLDRIDALTVDVSITQGFGDVISVLGMVEQDTENSAIRFDTRGFTTTLSAFREGLVGTPMKFWRRNNAAGDYERYLLADRTGGVLILNSNVEVLHRFPNFGANLVADQYDDASDCCTFSVGGTEYVAITMKSHHTCNIYEYSVDGTFQARIGVIDTSGDIAGYLNNPVGVACDEANSILYILCDEGQPAGATLNRGYITSYDVSTPSAPAFLAHDMYYVSTGSLLDAEVTTGTDIFFDGSFLWIANGNNEVGAIDLSGTSPRCVKYIEAAGYGYTLHAPAQVYVHDTLGGFKHVYVANGAAGLIETFDYLTLSHQKTYGYRALEDELNSYNRMSTAIYGAIGFAQGVVADRVLLDGEETDVMICADPLNKRLHRFNLNAYTSDNFANFDMMQFDVPISVESWTVSGDIPTDMVRVYYRYSETEQFRELNCVSAGLQPTSSIQFRVSIQLDSRRFVRDWFIRELIIHGKQA
jgi:hypothetical protein